MSLDIITAGGGLEEAFFWIFGITILGIGAIESYWRYKNDTNRSSDE